MFNEYLTKVLLKVSFIFYRYGPSVANYYNTPSAERVEYDLSNPMCETFPRIATCRYIRYGSGGGQTKLEAICILGSNMINDKANNIS